MYMRSLQSAWHEKWVWQHCSTSLELLRYTASSVLETFPFPAPSESLESVGHAYYVHRQQLIVSRKECLTAIYNKFHDPSVLSDDIGMLRSLQRELDSAIAAAYSWTDFDLEHGFHETKRGLRYTISEIARRKVLDRLLALNHQRHAEEEAAKIKTLAQPNPTTKHGRKVKTEVATRRIGSFDFEGAEHE